jgi:acetyl-CoA carboxylase biotin carboxyl carrier protein
MDLRKLKTLIDLVSESNISELEITEAEGKVRIVKSDGAPAGQPVMMMHAPTMTAMAAAQQASPGMVPPATSAATSAAETEAAAAATAAATAEATVSSPMVGTFYRSSTPGGKPLVDVGSIVKVGEPLCIIEAMKIMNEIEADRAGTVTRVCCENGQAVEFGQPLFIIE